MCSTSICEANTTVSSASFIAIKNSYIYNQRYEYKNLYQKCGYEKCK